jgi:hypothetical protein
MIAAMVMLAWVFTGCETPRAPETSVLGLRPEQPPLRYDPSRRDYAWPQLDTTQPMLRWGGFSGHEEPAANTNQPLAQIRSIAYDLRIWQAEGRFPGELRYSRDALPQPFHQVQTPLPAGASYFWTVRVRFDLNGETRVSEWSRVGTPEPTTAFPIEPGGITHPDARYFRFRIR